MIDMAFLVFALFASAVSLCIGTWACLAPYGSLLAGSLLLLCAALLSVGAILTLREQLNRGHTLRMIDASSAKSAPRYRLPAHPPPPALPLRRQAA